MSHNATKDHPWAGWHRQDARCRWTRIVSGNTFDEAFDRLLDAVEGGDLLVLPADQDPNLPRTAAPR